MKGSCAKCGAPLKKGNIQVIRKPGKRPRRDFHVDPPPRFRYFMTRDQAEKVKASVERNASFGFGIAFEVIPVLEHLVDQDPDAYADLVEVIVNWKGE